MSDTIMIDVPSPFAPRAEILAAQKEIKELDQNDEDVKIAKIEVEDVLKQNAELEKASTDG